MSRSHTPTDKEQKAKLPPGSYKKAERVPLPKIDPDQLYPVKLFEQYADCCHAFAYRLISSGAVKSVKLGRRRMIPGSAIIELTTNVERANALLAAARTTEAA
jgi:hypothetical protein